ncbi:nucleolar and spindle-associated protein 1 [Gouania willdenowi]|uniref:Nucleolar and spindle-associated protein 1 n=1 Tax=Gouania willdenowi TaxID=441366 RepID=A0A8C5GUM0_GOUWI|nr:nucleolar and spindle-associated protein 1 [Gouania willdenowi]
MDLDSMKYAELRTLAKEFGLKGNMKADKLLKALKLHYEQKRTDAETDQDNHDVFEGDKTPEENANNHKEESSGRVAFVNTRRVKAKRKISDVTPSIKLDVCLPAKAVEGVAEGKNSSNTRGAKKRRVFSKNKDEAEPELPVDIRTTEDEQQQHQSDTKDQEPLQSETEKAKITVKQGKIPRLQQRNKTLLKPVTPNFKKLHEAQFNKMESIDCYMQRKTKQMETHKNPVKDQKKTNVSHAGIFSPLPGNKRAAEGQRRHTVLSATKAPSNKPTGKEEAPFRPSVLSTRRINVRFSEATHYNENKKKCVIKPLDHMSPCAFSSTPRKSNNKAAESSVVKTSTSSVKKTPAPFVFSGNTSTTMTPGTQKKQTFDLKSSLSRTLAYQPHKGKLKPFGEVKENPTANKSLVSNPHQENYKQHKVQSREDRRVKQAEGRKQKKESLLGARRGLVMM